MEPHQHGGVASQSKDADGNTALHMVGQDIEKDADGVVLWHPVVDGEGEGGGWQ